MELRKKYDQLRNQRGYTIDQTILIVAVIAILITMIIVSVGWDILTRAGGTKLASHLKQFEQANGQFFAANAAWPHEAVSTGGADESNGSRIACVLLGNTGSINPVYVSGGVKNYLPGYTCSGGTTVTHGFGGGNGEVKVYRVPSTDASNGMGQDYIVVKMESVPLTEARSAKKDIDGEGTDDDKGRLHISNASGGTADVTYYATAIN